VECCQENNMIKQTYYQKNREKMLEQQKTYYQNHRQERNLYWKKYNIKNKEKISASKKKYRQEHFKKISIRGKNYYAKNRKTLLEKHKEYRQSNKGRIADTKAKARRRRNLNWILMFPNPFDELVEYHHITDTYVVAIPKDLHQQYMGKFHRENTMEIIKQIYLRGD